MTDYQLLPPLSAEEYAALKADIAARGVLVPIEVDEQGAVLDGHHRLRAWGELRAEGVDVPPYPGTLRGGLSEAGKVAHVVALNLARRHLTREDRAAVVRRLRDATGWSNPVLAEKFGISKDTVRRDLLATGADAPDAPDARVIDRNGVSRPAAIPHGPPEPTVRTLIAAGLATVDGIPPEPPELVAMRRLYIDFGITRFAAPRVAALVDPSMRAFYASVGEAFLPWLADFAAALRDHDAGLHVVERSRHETPEAGA